MLVTGSPNTIYLNHDSYLNGTQNSINLQIDGKMKSMDETLASGNLDFTLKLTIWISYQYLIGIWIQSLKTFQH